MSFSVFLRFIRIQAKTASAMPFILGTMYALYRFGSFNLVNSILYFVAQMLFAMFVTGWNNYMDYRLAKDPIYRQNQNILSTEHLRVKTVLIVLSCLFFPALFIGIWLVFRTNLFLLFAGALGFFIGIFYTFGIVPFSRWPLGELLSGVAEGFGVFFLAVYMNAYQFNYVSIDLNWPRVTGQGKVLELVALVFVAIPIILTVADVMFCDNICDLEQDQKNERYTLPYYLGKPLSMKLFKWAIYACFVFIFISILLRLMPWITIITFLGLPQVIKNVHRFEKLQDKEVTFINAIQNLMIIDGLQILALIIAVLWRWLV